MKNKLTRYDYLHKESKPKLPTPTYDMYDDVLVTNAESKGRINAICFSNDVITYKVVYWIGKNRFEVWLNEWEIECI